MSMFEFKKAIIEDEITEVSMKLFDHVAVNVNRHSRVYRISCGLWVTTTPRKSADPGKSPSVANPYLKQFQIRSASKIEIRF